MVPNRIPGLPVHWQQFLCCVVMHLLLPFLPLALEQVLTKHIDHKSLLLFVAMYSMAIGVTSSSMLIFSLTLIVGLVYCAGYGAAVKSIEAAGPFADVAWLVLITIAAVHLLERFNRHVADRAPFFEFGGPSSPAKHVPTQHGALDEPPNSEPR